jgi:hypothetical protein
MEDKTTTAYVEIVGTMNSFDRDLKEAYRQLPSPAGKVN